MQAKLVLSMRMQLAIKQSRIILSTCCITPKGMSSLSPAQRALCLMFDKPVCDSNVHVQVLVSTSGALDASLLDLPRTDAARYTLFKPRGSARAGARARTAATASTAAAPSAEGLSAVQKQEGTVANTASAAAVAGAGGLSAVAQAGAAAARAEDEQLAEGQNASSPTCLPPPTSAAAVPSAAAGAAAPGKPVCMVSPPGDGHVSCGWTFHQDDKFDRQGLLQLLQVLHVQAARVKGVFRVGPKTWVTARTVPGGAVVDAGGLAGGDSNGGGSAWEATVAPKQQEEAQQAGEQLQGKDQLQREQQEQAQRQQQQEVEGNSGHCSKAAVVADSSKRGCLELVELCYRGPSCIQVILKQDQLCDRKAGLRQQFAKLLSNATSTASRVTNEVQGEQTSAAGQRGNHNNGVANVKRSTEDGGCVTGLTDDGIADAIVAAQQGDWLPLELSLLQQLQK